MDMCYDWIHAESGDGVGVYIFFTHVLVLLSSILVAALAWVQFRFTGGIHAIAVGTGGDQMVIIPLVLLQIVGFIVLDWRADALYKAYRCVAESQSAMPAFRECGI